MNNFFTFLHKKGFKIIKPEKIFIYDYLKTDWWMKAYILDLKNEINSLKNNNYQVCSLHFMQREIKSMKKDKISDSV